MGLVKKDSDNTCDEPERWTSPEDADELERGRVAEREVDWEAFRREIKAKGVRARLGDELIAAAETYEALDLIKEEYTRAGIVEHEEILALRYLSEIGGFRTASLITFEWRSLGPMSWDASLNLLDIGVGLDYVVFCQDVEEDRIIFAIERTNWSSSATDIFRYACHTFTDGALPSQTVNYRPDLIPEEVIKAEYYDFLGASSDRGSPSWGLLREILQKELVNDPFSPFCKEIGKSFKGLPRRPSVEQIDLWLKEREEKERRETEELTAGDRQRILDTYFAASYQEYNN